MSDHLDRIEHAINELRGQLRTIDSRIDAINARLMTMDRRVERFAGESETRDARNLSVLRFEVENLRQALRQAAERQTPPIAGDAKPLPGPKRKRARKRKTRAGGSYRSA